jgi:hypothetical protein
MLIENVQPFIFVNVSVSYPDSFGSLDPDPEMDSSKPILPPPPPQKVKLIFIFEELSVWLEAYS